jgi:Virulence activator alpha C-term
LGCSPHNHGPATTWPGSPLTEIARSELMLRVRGLWLLSPERSRAFLLTQREEYESRLATYAMEEAAFLLEADAVDDPSPMFSTSTPPCATASCASARPSPGSTGCSTGSTGCIQRLGWPLTHPVQRTSRTDSATKLEADPS